MTDPTTPAPDDGSNTPVTVKDLNDFESSLVVRDAITAIATSVVNKLAPAQKSAVVQTVDRVGLTATVIMEGDTNPTTVAFLRDDGPWGAGDLVLVSNTLGNQRISKVVYSAIAPGGTYIAPAIFDMRLGGGTNSDKVVSLHYHSDGGSPASGYTWYYGRWINLVDTTGLAEVILSQAGNAQQVSSYTIPLFKVAADGNWYTVNPSDQYSYPSGYSLGLEARLSTSGAGYAVEFRALQIAYGATPYPKIAFELTLKGSWTKDPTAPESSVANSTSGTFNTFGGSNSMPTGAVLAYGGTTAPTGYLLCDGTAVSRSTYANLYAAIGTRYGAGDGSTTFNVPDGTGRYPRGDDYSGTYGGNSVHLHTLGPSGQAQINFDSGGAHINAVTADGWSATDTIPQPDNGGYGYYTTQGAGLSGSTDYGTSEPPWTSYTFIIKA